MKFIYKSYFFIALRIVKIWGLLDSGLDVLPKMKFTWLDPVIKVPDPAGQKSFGPTGSSPMLIQQLGK